MKKLEKSRLYLRPISADGLCLYPPNQGRRRQVAMSIGDGHKATTIERRRQIVKQL